MKFKDQPDKTTPVEFSRRASSTTAHTSVVHAGGCGVPTHWTAHTVSHEACCWSTACILNRANNKLQELMQLLYLLDRDPAIPKGIHRHLTIAQSEIALLSHQLRADAPSRAELPPNS